MKEIEVKILEVDRKALESRLINLGAEKIFDGVIDAEIFDFKGLKKRSLLRLRKEGERAVLTYKEGSTIGRTKQVDEFEIAVSDYDTAKKILEQLGLKSIENMIKHRTSYKLGDVKFEFDKYMGEHSCVPEFLEIEAKSEKALFEHVEKIGFKKEDCRPWSSKDVLRHYNLR